MSCAKSPVSVCEKTFVTGNSSDNISFVYYPWKNLSTSVFLLISFLSMESFPEISPILL